MQHTNVTIRYMRKQRMHETLTEQSITGETENARDTNGTIHYRRKLRMRDTLTEQSIIEEN